MGILAVQAGLEVRLGGVWGQEGTPEPRCGDTMRKRTLRLEVLLAIRATGTQVSSCTELVGISEPGTERHFGDSQLARHPQVTQGAGEGGMVPTSHAVMPSPISNGLHPGGRWAALGGWWRPSRTWSRGSVSFLAKTMSSERRWGDFKVPWSVTGSIGGYFLQSRRGQLALLLVFPFSQEKYDGGKSENYRLESGMSNLCSSSPRHSAIRTGERARTISRRRRKR